MTRPQGGAASEICPDCRGSFGDHNAVNVVSAGLVAHSTDGACWKSLNSGFTLALRAYILGGGS